MTMKMGKEDIEKACIELKHEWGWTFLMGPEDRLKTAKYAIVGLNPGRSQGDKTTDYKGLWATTENAQTDEEWRGQDQIAAWHIALDIESSESIGFNLVPFRSRNWKELTEPTKSIEFGKKLLNATIEVASARTYITMGKVTASHVVAELKASLVGKLPTGWGKHTIDHYNTPDGRRIVAMPHPSRYRLFGRGEPSQIAEKSFRDACQAELR